MKTDLHVLAEWLRGRGFEVDIKEHYLAANLRAIKEVVPDYPAPFPPSPWHLRVRGPKGRISVIRGGSTMGDFEMDSLEGDLLGFPTRCQSFKDASETIDSLLTKGVFVDSDDAD